MSDNDEWAFPPEFQPDADTAGFDLDRAVSAVVALSAEVPADAFTSSILGTERGGSAVVIRDDGLALTIGYLVTEAVNVRLTARDGRSVDAHPIAIDFPTGFGLVQPLGDLRVAPLERASAATLKAGDAVTAISHGGRRHALAARVVAKNEFAGYWEYLLDEALFTAPLHPAWSGAALLDARGRLVGIGSLFVQQVLDGETTRGNMFVPVDLLEPVLPDLLKHGRRAGPPRPWLGVYLHDEDGRVVVQDVAPDGPAAIAGLAPGDQIAALADQPVVQVAHAWRVLWRQGEAGVTIPATVVRDGIARRVQLTTVDRDAMLRKPRLQ
ncbi:Serine endoprotease DegS [Burkholderiales bacterium]|nr:Serine endoprotease DegS [Burkholderiales bacterium]